MTPIGHPSHVARLRAADPKLGKAIERIGRLDEKPFLRAHNVTPFVSLAHSISHQQLGGAAAEAIFGRMKKVLGGRVTAERLLAAKEADLRAAGMSQGKVQSLRELAARTLDGTVPRRGQMAALSDEEIIERLTSIRGIGLWTAEMLLLKLGRPDVLPATDLGIRRGFGNVFNRGEMVPPGDILSRGERWRPYRSTASLYLWRAS